MQSAIYGYQITLIPEHFHHCLIALTSFFDVANLKSNIQVQDVNSKSRRSLALVMKTGKYLTNAIFYYEYMLNVENKCTSNEVLGRK